VKNEIYVKKIQLCSAFATVLCIWLCLRIIPVA